MNAFWYIYITLLTLIFFVCGIVILHRGIKQRNKEIELLQREETLNNMYEHVNNMYEIIGKIEKH